MERRSELIVIPSGNCNQSMSDYTNEGRVSSRAHWIVFALAAAGVFNSAPITSAAIILQQSPPVPLPQGNLVQYTITAVGTEGERFVEPAIIPLPGSLGVHNVAWAVANSATPFKTSHTPPLFEPSWAAYDSFFLFGDAFEPPLSESNDGTTTGVLGLSSGYGTPRSGFGTFTPGLGPPILVTPAGSNIPLMQVVMRRGDFALFDVEVRAEGGGVLAVFDDFLIGVPEPATIALLFVPLLGLFTKYRLRNYL